MKIRIGRVPLAMNLDAVDLRPRMLVTGEKRQGGCDLAFWSANLTFEGELICQMTPEQTGAVTIVVPECEGDSRPQRRLGSESIVEHELRPTEGVASGNFGLGVAIGSRFG